QQQDTDAHRNPPWVRLLHVHVVSTQQRHLEPSQLARGQGRKLRIQVERRREVSERDLGGVEVVQPDQLAQQLLGGLGDGLRGVRACRGRAPNASYRHAFKRSLTSATASPPRSISFTIALPTAAASTVPRSERMCSGLEMPKPAAMGSCVCLRNSPNSSCMPSGSSL